ncbi:MAG: glycosyltransferase [Verrucomicrobia bacterium]|nr:glycosyltransferase [Verrucomicrobiota bacterium]
MRKRITWMVVGPTVRRDYEQEVLNVAKQAGVKVERLTDVNDTDLRKLYRECHVMLFTPRALPGSIEGLGLVSLEAAASGLPIVATASGGVAEGLEPNVNALLVPEGDLAATANALLRLLNSNDLWQKFASAGPGIATRFSWQRNVSQLLD